MPRCFHKHRLYTGVVALWIKNIDALSKQIIEILSVFFIVSGVIELDFTRQRLMLVLLSKIKQYNVNFYFKTFYNSITKLDKLKHIILLK